MIVARVAVVLALSGCTNYAAIANRNLQTWVGSSIESAADAMGNPRSASRSPGDVVAYDWQVDGVCVDMGYRVIGNLIIPSRPCSIGCGWTMNTSRDGTILSAVLGGADTDYECPLPSVSNRHSGKFVSFGALHTHNVTFVANADGESFFREASACDDRFKRGERVRWASLGGTPGLWPSNQGCCVDQDSAICVPYPAKKSLFDLF